MFVANPPCGVETLCKTGSRGAKERTVANPPCGVETLAQRLELSLTNLVANPPCGVET